MKSTLLKCLGTFLTVLVLFFVLCKFGWMISCFHHVFLFLVASILYYMSNLVTEYKSHLGTLNGKRKKKNVLMDVLISMLFFAVIGNGLAFIVRQICLIVSIGEITVVVKKIVWAMIVLSIVVGGFLYRRHERNILQNMYIVVCAVFFVYILFTFNQISIRCNDLIFVDDFCQEGIDSNTGYDEVFRFQSEGIFGDVKRVAYIGRDQEVAQEYKFQYTIYSAKNRWGLRLIKNQYAGIVDEARVTTVNNVTIYEVECDRKKEYELGTTYYVSNEEEYDYLIIVEDDKKVLEFYYRDFKNLSQKAVCDIVVDKFLEQ